MSQAPTAGLAQAVAAEAAAVNAFVQLLRREQAALSSGQIDELPAFAEQKSALAGELGALARARNAALATQGLPPDRAGVAAWCAKNPTDKKTPAAWAQILVLAGEARELIRVSSELIALRMNYNSKALDALLGASKSLDLYGPDGQTTASANRRINDAV